MSYVSHSLYSVPTQEEMIGNLIVFLVVVLVFLNILFISVDLLVFEIQRC